MKNIVFFSLLFAPFVIFSQQYQVERVVDGDTVIINIDGVSERLRIIGIDTPETVKQGNPIECFGIEASKRAKDLLGDTFVRLELNQERDAYNRLLGHVFVENNNFGLIMIREGYAYAFRAFEHNYYDQYIQAETQARNNKVGLWADDACSNDTDSAASQIVYQEKISFWQNIFRSIQNLFNLFFK